MDSFAAVRERNSSSNEGFELNRSRTPEAASTCNSGAIADAGVPALTIAVAAPSALIAQTLDLNMTLKMASLAESVEWIAAAGGIAVIAHPGRYKLDDRTRAALLGEFRDLGGVGISIWNVITVSLRQRITPGRLLGRVNSAYRLVAWGTMPLGAIAGGLLAEFLGLRAVFVIMACR